jgi:protein SCO1/2
MKKTLKLPFPFLVCCLATSFLTGCNQKQELKEKPNPKQQISAPEPNTESIYQLTGEWHDQNGETLQLKELTGKIPVMAMIFTGCKYACTRIVDDIQNIEKQVPADKKDKVVFVLVSFDSERDKPARLKAFADTLQLDDRWILLHGNEETVRELSMLLNVKYKKQPNGDFGHSNGITLLNEEGAIVTQTEGLGIDPKPILDAIKRL